MNYFFHKKDDCSGKLHELYERIYYLPDGSWQISLVQENLNCSVEEGIPEEIGPPDFHFSLSVRFPETDYKLVLNAI